MNAGADTSEPLELGLVVQAGDIEGVRRALADNVDDLELLTRPCGGAGNTPLHWAACV